MPRNEPVFTCGCRIAINQRFVPNGRERMNLPRVDRIKIFTRLLSALLVASSLAISSANSVDGGPAARPPQDNLPETIPLSAEERAWLAEHPVIRYGLDNWPPIEYHDGQGQPAGIASDYMRKIAELLGVRLVSQPLNDWPNALEALARGEFDLIPSVMPTPERRQGPWHFTTPYVAFPAAIFAPVGTPLIGSMDELAGHRVLVMAGYASEEWMRTEYPEIELVLAPDVRTAVRMLAEGRADALIGNLFAVSHAISIEKRFQIRVAGETPFSFDLAMVVRPDWPELAQLLERAIAAIAQSERDVIQSRWLRAPPPAEIDRRLLWRVLGGSALVLALILLWNFSLGREIARRRRAERDLAASEQRYRGMVESARSVLNFYSLDPQGVVIDVTSGSSDLFGMNDRDMIGRHWRDIADWSSDTLVRTQRALATCWLGEAPLPVSLNYKLNGERRHLVSFARPVKDGNNKVVRVDGLSVNLTDRLQLEEEVRDLETSFQTMFEHSPLPMLISSGADERTLMVNKRFRDVLGYDIEDIPDVAHWWPLAYPDPEYRQHIQALWQQRMEQAAATQSVIEPVEARVRCGDGQSRTFIGHAATLHQRHLLMFIDVTEQRATEARLRAAQAKAEAANRAKTEFLANISHEIRTPMNAVLGMQQLCLDEELSETQRDFLLTAQGAARTLLGLLNDLLDFSKIEAGRLRLDAHPFVLSQVFEQVRGIIAHPARNKGLDFAIHCAPEVPEALYGDALRLNQILLNLANNALKFTEQGSIRIDARLLERLPADADVPRERVHLEFRVQDTGIGLGETDCAELFQPFHQADGSITRRYGGTGLGLSICKRLVLMMDGAIGVDSTPGQGSTFWFTIWSQCPLPDEQPARAESQSSVQVLPELVGRRVLLVEDNEVNRLVARTMLERAGIEVSEAEHGIAALAQLQQRGCAAFDLVLMDVQMAEMGGLEATRRIRTLPDGDQLPIIGLTAHVRDEDVARAHQAGMNAHLGKPFEVTRLYQLIAEQLGLEVNTAVPVVILGGVPETPDLPAIPGLDPAALRMTLGPDVTIWSNFLRLFADIHTGSLARIDAALAVGDHALAEREAHSLGSAAGNLGLTEIRAAARTLEDRLRDAPHASDELAKAHTQLAEQLDRALTLIIAWHEQRGLDQSRLEQTEDARPSAPVDHERLDAVLRHLHDLTQAYNPVAEELWRENRTLLRAGLAPDTYERLDHQISNYRFSEASATLEPVQRQVSLEEKS